jgi:AcrR family transcriptional regulator
MREGPATASRRLTRAERERVVLDAAARLYYSRGVHEVGMDELICEAGLGKATVYRLYPSKDVLVGAYLERLAGEILAAIDAEIARRPDDPGGALLAVLDTVEADLRRPGFRGCAFNNASIEYDDPGHPAREQARRYREALCQRLMALADALTGGGQSRPGGPGIGTEGPATGPGASRLGAQLAVLIDGAYTSAAHLGADGPAADGLRLARQLVTAAGTAR